MGGANGNLFQIGSGPVANDKSLFAMSDVLDIETADGDDENLPTLGDAGDDDQPRPNRTLGLTRMSLQELKEKSPADLLAFAEQFDIENANAMRKQDMMFAILTASAEEGLEIFG